MKNKLSSEKEPAKREGLLKFLLYGFIAAVILFSLITVLRKEDAPVETKNVFEWSAETDSNFVKNCYDQYRPQVRDDMTKQESSKMFCRCMLQKVKTKYDEKSIGKVTDDDIKQWDAECREMILNGKF